MYLGGLGVQTDNQQAVLWYRKAAAQGNADAQFMLGVMYGAGSGVPKDEQMEYFWLLLASAQGNKSAIKVRAEVERHLLPEQRAAAQASARTWKPKAE
jgi:TPR repeat protein